MSTTTPNCARSRTTNACTNDTTIPLSPFPCPQTPRRETRNGEGVEVVLNRTGSGGPSPSSFLIWNNPLGVREVGRFPTPDSNAS